MAEIPSWGTFPTHPRSGSLATRRKRVARNLNFTRLRKRSPGRQDRSPERADSTAVVHLSNIHRRKIRRGEIPSHWGRRPLLTPDNLRFARSEQRRPACNAGATAAQHFGVDMVALRENVHDRQGRVGRRPRTGAGLSCPPCLGWCRVVCRISWAQIAPRARRRIGS